MEEKKEARSFKEQLEDKFNFAKREVQKLYSEHELEIKLLALSSAPFVASGVKGALKNYKKNKEQREAECMFYDFSQHVWYESKRPLTNREKLRLGQLERQVGTGEALRRMGLLR